MYLDSPWTVVVERPSQKAHTELCLPSSSSYTYLIMRYGSWAGHSQQTCLLVSSTVLNLSYLFMLMEIMCACSFQGPPKVSLTLDITCRAKKMQLTSCSLAASLRLCHTLCHNHPSYAMWPYHYYSRTPLFWTSEIRTRRFNGRFTQVRITSPLTAVYYSPLFRKADRFFGLSSTWTV